MKPADSPSPRSEPARIDSDPNEVVPVPATGPPRVAFILAFAGTVVCGLLGSLIGFGLVQLDSPDATAAQAIGAIIGGVLTALGAGIVAVLVLRAMSEWGRHGPGPS